MSEPNGNGMTTRDLLIRIEGKVDTIAAAQTALEIKHAVHAARPSHEDSRSMQKIDALTEKVQENRIAVSKGAVVVAIVVLVVNILAPILIYSLFFADKGPV